MFREGTIDELLQRAGRVKNFVVAKGYSYEQLITLAEQLKEKKKSVTAIYWLDGSDTLNDASFNSIRLRPRIVIARGQRRAKMEGLIFPQTEPIILVIANFSQLEQEDQNMYLNAICKKEAIDYHPHLYLHEDSIVLLGIDENALEPEPRQKVDFWLLR